MSVPEDKNRETPVENTHVPTNGEEQAPSSGADSVHTSYEQTTDHDHDAHYRSDESHHDDPYTGQSYGVAATGGESTAVVPVSSSNGGGGVPPPAAKDEEDEEAGDGMLRMSFLEHLEELRKRIVSILIGVGIAFAGALIFAPGILPVSIKSLINFFGAGGRQIDADAEVDADIAFVEETGLHAAAIT